MRGPDCIPRLRDQEQRAGSTNTTTSVELAASARPPVAGAVRSLLARAGTSLRRSRAHRRACGSCRNPDAYPAPPQSGTASRSTNTTTSRRACGERAPTSRRAVEITSCARGTIVPKVTCTPGGLVAHAGNPDVSRASATRNSEPVTKTTSSGAHRGPSRGLPRSSARPASWDGRRRRAWPRARGRAPAAAR